MVSVVDLRSLYHDASISKQLCVNCGGSTSCTFQGVEGHPYVMLHGVRVVDPLGNAPVLVIVGRKQCAMVQSGVSGTQRG